MFPHYKEDYSKPVQMNYDDAQLTMMTLRQRHAYEYTPYATQQKPLSNNYEKYPKINLSQNRYSGIYSNLDSNSDQNRLIQSQQNQSTKLISFSSRLVNCASWIREKVTSMFRVDPTQSSANINNNTIDLNDSRKELDIAIESPSKFSALNFRDLSRNIESIIADQNDRPEYKLYKQTLQQDISDGDYDININKKRSPLDKKYITSNNYHLDKGRGFQKSCKKNTLIREKGKVSPNLEILPKRPKKEKVSLRRILNFYEILANKRREEYLFKKQAFQRNLKHILIEQVKYKPEPIRPTNGPLFEFVWSKPKKMYEYRNLFTRKRKSHPYEKSKKENADRTTIEIENDLFHCSQKKVKMNQDKGYQNEKTVYIQFQKQERTEEQQGKVRNSKLSSIYIHEQEEEESTFTHKKCKKYGKKSSEMDENQSSSEIISKTSEDEESFQKIVKPSKIKVNTKKRKQKSPAKNPEPNQEIVHEERQSQKEMKNVCSQTSPDRGETSSKRKIILADGQPKNTNSMLENLAENILQNQDKQSSTGTGEKREKLNESHPKEIPSLIELLNKKEVQTSSTGTGETTSKEEGEKASAQDIKPEVKLSTPEKSFFFNNYQSKPLVMTIKQDHNTLSNEHLDRPMTGKKDPNSNSKLDLSLSTNIVNTSSHIKDFQNEGQSNIQPQQPNSTAKQTNLSDNIVLVKDIDNITDSNNNIASSSKDKHVKNSNTMNNILNTNTTTNTTTVTCINQDNNKNKLGINLSDADTVKHTPDNSSSNINPFLQKPNNNSNNGTANPFLIKANNNPNLTLANLIANTMNNKNDSKINLPLINPANNNNNNNNTNTNLTNQLNQTLPNFLSNMNNTLMNNINTTSNNNNNISNNNTSNNINNNNHNNNNFQFETSCLTNKNNSNNLHHTNTTITTNTNLFSKNIFSNISQQNKINESSQQPLQFNLNQGQQQQNLPKNESMEILSTTPISTSMPISLPLPTGSNINMNNQNDRLPRSLFIPNNMNLNANNGLNSNNLNAAINLNSNNSGINNTNGGTTIGNNNLFGNNGSNVLILPRVDQSKPSLSLFSNPIKLPSTQNLFENQNNGANLYQQNNNFTNSSINNLCSNSGNNNNNLMINTLDKQSNLNNNNTNDNKISLFSGPLTNSFLQQSTNNNTGALTSFIGITPSNNQNQQGRTVRTIVGIKQPNKQRAFPQIKSL